MGKLKKYSKIKRLGHDITKPVTETEGECILREKLDGANFRGRVIRRDGEFKWLFGSRNVEYKKENGEPDYSEDVDGRFTDAIQAVRETAPAEEVMKKYGSEYTFFFENMVPHSLEYPFDEMPQVIGFDIYEHDTGWYMPVEKSIDVMEELGFETAPIIDRIPVEEFDSESYEIPESEFRDGKMEGVVIINEKARNKDHISEFTDRGKMVTEEFAEKHKRKTGARQSKEAIHGHEKIVSKYCTDARIEKHIHKMRDAGRDLGMELMEGKNGEEGLPMRVAIDILQEEASEIARRNDKMKWKNFRDLIADRCVYKLRQEISKNAGGGEE